MNLILQISLILFLAVWSFLGIWLIRNYARLFGPDSDDPSETVGARSLGMAHLVSIWIGCFALAAYFLIK